MSALLPAQFDRDRFQRLLALVGPVLAPDLLRQLAADLTAVAADIARATKAGDFALMREASHVLISLSGSVGALALHDMAKALNVAAHAGDRAALEGLIPALTADLRALIALVEGARGGAG